jgi:hypothetical protein
MDTVNDGPKLDNTPEGCANAAIIDNEWFKAHPGSTMYKRDVIPGEVPSSLRSKDIRKVRVARINQGIILYEFADKCDDPVGYSLFFPNEFCSTDEGRNQASVCLRLLNSLGSLGSEDA